MKKIYGFIEKFWWCWPILAGAVTYLLIMMLSGDRSVWFDESYSIALAQQPIGELLALTAVDAHPPFYYILLKAWAGIFGWSEFALRSLSAVLVGGTVAVAFLLLKRLFTLKTALGILPFLILAPFLLRYGYEIRMYALVGFIGVVSTLVLVYAQQAKKSIWPWVAYGAIVALGMYTLYFSVVIWIAQFVYLLWGTLKAHRPFYKERWCIALAGAVVLFLPYLPTVVYQLTHSALPGIGSEVTLTTIGGILSMLFTYTPDWQQTAIISVGILIVIILGIQAVLATNKVGSVEVKNSLRLLLILAIVPFLLFTLISIAQGAFVYRYMSHVAIFVYILIGVLAILLWRYTHPAKAILYTFLTLLLFGFGTMTLLMSGNFIFERLQLPQSQQVRASVACDKGVTIADDPYTYIDSRYYFQDCDYRFFSADPIAKQGGYAMLADSTVRVTEASELDETIIYHLHWKENDTKFVPDSRYQLTHTSQFDKQVIDTYQLIAE